MRVVASDDQRVLWFTRCRSVKPGGPKWRAPLPPVQRGASRKKTKGRLRGPSPSNGTSSYFFTGAFASLAGAGAAGVDAAIWGADTCLPFAFMSA